MSKPRAMGLALMVVGVCAYGTAPDWLALLVGLLGLAATLFADLRYLRLAIARRHFSFLIDRAILLTARRGRRDLPVQAGRLRASMRRDASVA
jgi:hypothetical protein